MFHLARLLHRRIGWMQVGAGRMDIGINTRLPPRPFVVFSHDYPKFLIPFSLVFPFFFPLFLILSAVLRSWLLQKNCQHVSIRDA
jgi:hypothetical protein